MATAPSQEWLTAQEAATRLRCCERTIRRMINRGDLPGLFVAGRWLVDPDDLHQLGVSTVPPAPPRPRRRIRDDLARRYSSIADDIIAARQRASR